MIPYNISHAYMYVSSKKQAQSKLAWMRLAELSTPSAAPTATAAELEAGFMAIQALAHVLSMSGSSSSGGG